MVSSIIGLRNSIRTNLGRMGATPSGPSCVSPARCGCRDLRPIARESVEATAETTDVPVQRIHFSYGSVHELHACRRHGVVGAHGRRSLSPAHRTRQPLLFFANVWLREQMVLPPRARASPHSRLAVRRSAAPGSRFTGTCAIIAQPFEITTSQPETGRPWLGKPADRDRASKHGLLGGRTTALCRQRQAGHKPASDHQIMERSADVERRAADTNV
jgi:hypothetical protein